MRSRLSVLCFALLLAARPASASVPPLMNYQGYLTDASSNPKSGTFPMTFALFADSTGGTALWSESYASVSVTSGVFNVVLGSATQLPPSTFTGAKEWLETTVSGTVLTPRRPLISVAYSFKSQRADTANVALGTSSGGDWQSDGTNVWRATGRVGIGVTSPNSVLDINSTTGDHTVNSIHYSATNPKIKLDALASGNYQSEVQFLKGGTTRWSLLNDVLGDDSQNIGFKDWVSGTTRFMIDALGDVGINTTTFANAGNPEVMVKAIGPGSAGYIGAVSSDGTSSVGLRSGTGGDGSLLCFQNNIGFGSTTANGTQDFSEKVRITSAGNVGIGTNSPRCRLDVNGSSRIASPDGNLAVWATYLGYPNMGSILFDSDRTGYTFVIGNQRVSDGNILPIITMYDGGNVGIGTSTPSAKLHVAGNVQIDGSLTVNQTKCRAVSTEFGQLKMNAAESGHALFMDDQPTARLLNGRCRVNLSREFLATVTVNGKYPLAVNVTFYGRHGGEWYIERDATGFTVVDPSGSNAEFSWQAIARQRNYESVYLDSVEQAAAK